jgi:hypothetical protein
MKSILISTALMATLAGGTVLAQSTGSTDSSATAGQSQVPAATQSQPQPPTSSQPASPASAAATAPAGPRIAPGSVIPVQLTKTIDAKKAKPGDEVVAKVTMDLKTNSGEVIVPKDTKVTGHVTEVQARSKDQKESQVGIAFDHAALKDGDVALPMSIQAVIAPPTNNENGGSGADQGPAAGGSAPTSSMGANRTGAMGGAGQTQPSTPTPNAVPATGTDTQQSGARPTINGKTQGVVGIANLTLDAGQNATQGSVLSSEKNNVKVESGTMLLLKVNP